MRLRVPTLAAACWISLQPGEQIPSGQAARFQARAAQENAVATSGGLRSACLRLSYSGSLVDSTQKRWMQAFLEPASSSLLWIHGRILPVAKRNLCREQIELVSKGLDFFQMIRSAQSESQFFLTPSLALAVGRQPAHIKNARAPRDPLSSRVGKQRPSPAATAGQPFMLKSS